MPFGAEAAGAHLTKEQDEQCHDDVADGWDEEGNTPSIELGVGVADRQGEVGHDDLRGTAPCMRPPSGELGSTCPTTERRAHTSQVRCARRQAVSEQPSTSTGVATTAENIRDPAVLLGAVHTHAGLQDPTRQPGLVSDVETF